MLIAWCKKLETTIGRWRTLCTLDMANRDTFARTAGTWTSWGTNLATENQESSLCKTDRLWELRTVSTFASSYLTMDAFFAVGMNGQSFGHSYLQDFRIFLIRRRTESCAEPGVDTHLPSKLRRAMGMSRVAFRVRGSSGRGTIKSPLAVQRRGRNSILAYVRRRPRPETILSQIYSEVLNL